MPSGKTIEVVYFEDLAAPTQATPADADTADLHVCVTCACELVYPVEWEEAGAEDWEVTVRCLNCQRTGTGVYTQATVERFDDHLDRGTEVVVRDLRRLTHANMEQEIERFVGALEANLILPEDF